MSRRDVPAPADGPPLDDRWREFVARTGYLAEAGTGIFGGDSERPGDSELAVALSAAVCAVADLLAWFLGWSRGRAPLDDLWLGAESANFAAHGCIRPRGELVAACRPRRPQQETAVRVERVCPTLFIQSPDVYILAAHLRRGAAAGANPVLPAADNVAANGAAANGTAVTAAGAAASVAADDATAPAADAVDAGIAATAAGADADAASNATTVAATVAASAAIGAT